MEDLFARILNVSEEANTKKAEIIETTSVVMRDVKTGEEKEIKNEHRVLDTRFVLRRPTYLSVKLTTSINMGNFQSAKVEKGLFVPVGTEADPKATDRIRATDEWASKLLDALIEKEVKPLLDERAKTQEAPLFG